MDQLNVNCRPEITAVIDLPFIWRTEHLAGIVTNLSTQVTPGIKSMLVSKAYHSIRTMLLVTFYTGRGGHL
jgi:hypothetical protein